MISLIALARALYPVCAWFPHGALPAVGVPVNTALPVISGLQQVGQILSVSNGAWTNSPNSYTYQWCNEGVPLTGAGNPTTANYTQQPSDIGCLISCIENAVNLSGTSLPAFTALVGPAIGATAFYVSQSVGNDSWDGTAPAFVSGTTGPWKTIAHVNAQTFSAGTSVLFKRGDTWRNDGCSTSTGTQLSPTSNGSPGNPIVFDAYGTGAAPAFDGSYDLSTTGAWQTTGTTNVWQSAHQFNSFGHANGLPNNAADDPGNLIWGISAVGGTNVPGALVNAHYGVMTGSSFNNVWYQSGDNQANLTATGQWNFNTDTNRIQVYCVGNPATNLPGVSGDLRAAIDTCLIYFNQQHDLTFQNMTLQYCGATAFDTGGAGGACSNIIMRDMVVQWIGGGNISGQSNADSRYGDGWDMEGSCSGMLVDRIWWHQCYDTGPGPQCGQAHQDNITIRNNVATYCGGWFSTFFLGGIPGTCSGLSIYNNTVYLTANCWSNNPTQRPNGAENVFAFNIGTVSTTLVQSNLTIRNNIHAGISGVSPAPGFGLVATAWNVGGGVNLSNPFTSSGAWLDYDCWTNNTLSPTGAPAQDIALSGGNYRMVDWIKGTNVAGAGTFTPALEPHGLFTDPLFVSQSAFNFALQSGSPCRNAGANLYSSGVALDFNHNPRPSSGPFSMGAFQ